LRKERRKKERGMHGWISEMMRDNDGNAARERREAGRKKLSCLTMQARRV
jgi:hypothetical protein